MIIKKLEKKMTIAEANEYIKSHPKWRLPTSEESETIETEENYYFIDKTTSNDTVPLNRNTVCNAKFKNNVILVPALKNVLTATVFIIKSTEISVFDYGNIEILTRASDNILLDKSIINNWQIFDDITKARITSIMKVMNENDVLIIKNNERYRNDNNT